eukprot:TRINITY_DN7829_c0_g2_i1.p1 TRINITY_DN7829_c0_g2~~TRINITY_DN7829_c0_g2_i1.p1  ORF type:complete len:362 (+),score=32.96 TRINITY_DN7829_c0_g2_i1:92-1177(+)
MSTLPSSLVYRTIAVLAILPFVSCFQLSAARSKIDERGRASFSGDDNRLCETMDMLWTRAAQILNVNYVADCTSLYQFYNSSWAHMKSWHISDKTINYMPVWKSANNAISCNLDNAASFGGGFYEPGFPGFTFVREPLERFVSGYSEINFKAYDCQVGGDFQTYPLDSTERAKQFIADLLGSRFNRECWVPYHIFSQLGPVHTAPSHLDYIGRLENLENGWLAVGGLVGITMPPWDSVCGAHPSTDAESGFAPRDAMGSLLTNISQLAESSEPSLVSESLASSIASLADMESLSIVSAESQMRRFLDVSGAGLVLACSVFLPDYICFQYPLPVTEEQCVGAGFASSVDEWRWKVEEIRHFC